MIFDVIACIPTQFTELIFTGSNSEGNYNEVMRLARLNRLYRLLRIAR